MKRLVKYYTKVYCLLYLCIICLPYSCYIVLLGIFPGDSDSSIWSLFKHQRDTQIVQRCFRFQQGWLSSHPKEEGGSSVWLGHMGCCTSKPGIRSTGNKFPQSFLRSTGISRWNSFHPKQTHTLPVQHTAGCAGASWHLAAMPHQAQELPGSHHFSRDYLVSQF